MAQDCLFCKIASGEVDSKVVHDGDEVVAFEDISPQAPVHLLVVPRRHIPSAATLSRDDAPLLAEMFEVMASIASERELSSGFRIVTNVGPEAGQSVDHLHFHLLGGRHLSWPPG